MSGRLARGAYGLELAGLDGAGHLLPAAAAGWRRLAVERVAGSGTGVEGAHRIPLRPAGTLVIAAPPTRCTFALPEPPPDAALVHPYLALAAAVVATAHGWQTFHAGAFALDGGAWVVLGDVASGKSSLLGAIATEGLEVLADDLVCIRGGAVAAGPRCVDFRRETAATLGLGEPLGIVGSRERWRLPLDDVAPETPLRGWITLEWGEPPGVAAVRVTERLPALLRNAAALSAEPDYERLLALADAPFLLYRRPRNLASLQKGAAVLVAALRDEAP